MDGPITAAASTTVLRKYTHTQSGLYLTRLVGTVYVGTGRDSRGRNGWDIRIKTGFRHLFKHPVRYGCAGLLIVETKELFLCFVIDCNCSLQR